MRLENKSYLMRIGPQDSFHVLQVLFHPVSAKEYIAAREELEVLARFINDCRNPAASVSEP